ncbi:related to YTM1-microtubule-interacting protein [Sporisorium reilianum SRZ2]|uniref:Related to YTM1-microtubule-interacting protein n=1 Tax=Sporisorium reilianum (strain SRZ2) TaxID=999809 RepID=E7A0X7_SPORE|nr:related to YTM1-microtubule-interacting protein [Sporisorium reilianum SRZ2]
MSAINDYDSPAMASSAAPATAAEQTVPIILTTSLDQYAIPSGPYMVPVSWRRTHLSTLVNKLVSSTSEDTAGGAVPFDFIIDSALLRTTLGEYLEAGGLTSESTLTIEYVRSTLPPTRLAAFEHDDWVASVDCSFAQTKIYMTSSYDGSVRLFTPSNPTEAAYTLSTINKATVQGGRNTSLTSAKWTPNGDALVTGGMDGKVQLWNVSQSVDDDVWKSSRKWVGEAHNAPVGAVDTAQGPQGSSVLSGGWNGIVAVWDDLPLSSSRVESESDDEEQEEETTAKRRKTANGTASTSKASTSRSKPGQIDPTMTLYHAAPTAHAVMGAKNVFTATSRVTALLFERTFASACAKDTNRAWSVGYNGQLKGWDLGSGGMTHTSLSLPSSTAESRPMLSLAQLSHATLVTGTMDRTIHMFDTRSSGTLGVSVANAHRGPVDALAAHPLDGHLFASASGLESAVKVWDSRSSKKALFTLETAGAGAGKGEKGVLAVDWARDGQELVAGGKDKRITVFRGSNIGLSDGAQA